MINPYENHKDTKNTKDTQREQVKVFVIFICAALPEGRVKILLHLLRLCDSAADFLIHIYKLPNFIQIIHMHSYDTVVDAINGLKQRGYSHDFNIEFDKIICDQTKICLDPSEFEITEVYRFEGDSNPSDEDVVYAVESMDGKVKGIITSAFGLYADPISDQMIKKLHMHTNH